MRILILDNEKDGLYDLAETLARKYETVECASSLEQGKSLFQGGSFDMVIVALEMDGNEGYRFLEYLEEAHPRQKTITFSAEVERPSATGGCAVCQASFCRKRLLKPLRIQKLFDLIDDFDHALCPMAELKNAAASSHQSSYM